MKKKILGLVLSIALISSSLTGCTSLKNEMIVAMNNNQDIQISVDGETYTHERNAVDWVELDQLTTFKDIRKVWDDKFQIVKFDIGSKNGVLYVDTDGNWAGNNTLYNVFQNKTFVKDFWSDNTIKSELAQAAMDEFSDISNESTGIVASINAYFNILPTNTDGTSGLTDKLSRAEVMSAICRGDTPVIFKTTNQEFIDAVGENVYNDYASEVAGYSYLDYNNGSLNNITYNSAMTRAEAVYILMHRYFPNELDTVTGGSLADCKNAGNLADKLGFTGKHAYQSYELEYSLQNIDKGAPEKLYKALVLANKLGVISSDTKWSNSITGGELLNMMVKCYQAVSDRDGFAVNAKTGANVGQSLYVQIEEPEQPEIVEESELGSVVVEQVRDVTNLDDLFNIYGDEIDMTDEEIAEAYEVASQFTFSPCDTWKQVDYCTYLNVRTGPSTDFRILSSVPAKTKAHIVARCNENGWYRIVTEGKIVYQCGVYFSDFEGSEEYATKTVTD